MSFGSRRGEALLGFVLVLVVGLGAGLAMGAPPSPPSSRPGITVDGPVDLDRLLQLTRLRESMTARLVYSYTYRQTSTDEKIGPDGRVLESGTRVYQVIPTPQGTERVLLSKDGRDPTPAEERKQERRNEALQRRFAKMQERARREAERRRVAAPASAPAARSAPAATASQPKPAPATPVRPATATATATSSAPDLPVPVVTAPTPEPGVAPPPAPTPASVAAPPPEREPLPPLPACDFDDPQAAVRPPLPGSITRARAPGLGAPEQARRKRERPSDYSLFELLNMTDHEYAGACSWEGRPMHVVAFRPPEGFDPLNPVERVMGAMAGSILIDGGDLEVARAEGATIAPITWGAGMVKLKSARVILEYGRVRDEFWLPKREVFEYETRVVFDNDHERYTHVFDDFQKAETSVETEFGGPVED